MRKLPGSRLALCVLTAALLAAGQGPVRAQIPDEFTNLKLLPKDIGKRELVGIMREFSGALGVRCVHCHPSKNGDALEGMDFATDEREAKRVARGMMTMVGQINGKLLPASGRDDPVQVRCVTCHRGVREPESLDRLLLEVFDEGGAHAAASRYRELREEYYGSGSYAFGPETLSSVAETVASERGDLGAAIALMKLDLEFHPDAAYAHIMLGQLLAASGDREAALASIERGLELDPDNQRARQMLQRLRPPE